MYGRDFLKIFLESFCDNKSSPQSSQKYMNHKADQYDHSLYNGPKNVSWLCDNIWERIPMPYNCILLIMYEVWQLTHWNTLWSCGDGLIMFSAETHISFCAFAPFSYWQTREEERGVNATQSRWDKPQAAIGSTHTPSSLSQAKILKPALTSEHLFTSSLGHHPRAMPTYSMSQQRGGWRDLLCLS